jgi:hypothetical protein
MTQEHDYMDEELRIGFLIGKTITAIEVNEDKDEIRFSTSEGNIYKMYHQQDCCESVGIDDIIGDINDLIGSPIIIADERSSEEPPVEIKAARAKEAVENEYYSYNPDSETWTFYELATNKGSVTLRWHGSSNGYYSESVDFVEIKP